MYHDTPSKSGNFIKEPVDVCDVLGLWAKVETDLTQQRLKEMYGYEIQDYARAHNMLKPVGECKRCWRLTSQAHYRLIIPDVRVVIMKRRIVLAQRRPVYPWLLGGAARAAHVLLHTLNCQSINVCAVGASWGEAQTRQLQAASGCGANYQYLPDKSGVNTAVPYPSRVTSSFEAELYAIMQSGLDLIWTQLEGGCEIARASLARGLRTLVMVVDAEGNWHEIAEVYRQGASIGVCSRFLQSKLRSYGVESSVIYPIADNILDRFGPLSNDPAGPILMLNTFPQKGIETFLKIAALLPGQKFLLVESWPMREAQLSQLQRLLDHLPNVSFLRRQYDISTCLAGASLLLVPSVWEEGFGIVALEAQAAGIPVIASNRGGLSESVGEGGKLISDYRNAHVWVREIVRLQRDRQLYAHLSCRARANCRRLDFTSENVVREFFKLVQWEEARRSMGNA